MFIRLNLGSRARFNLTGFSTFVMLIYIEYQNRLHVKANIILRKAIMLFKKKIRFTGGVDELRFKKERKEH